VLSACGGGTLGPNSIFIGSSPITEADYVGKTFPARYVGRNDAGDLFRGAGTVRYISSTEIEVKVEGIDEILIEDSPGMFLGATIYAETSLQSPELVTAFATDEVTVEYFGFLGFETTSAGLPTENLYYYDDIDGSVLLLSNGVDSGSDFGGTFLDVDFDTGIVTGLLHSSDNAEVSIVGGAISGNGISGGAELETFSIDFPVISETVDSDTSGTFFGPDATALAGTYEGTGIVDGDADIGFVGAFIGIKTLPPL